MHPLKVHAFVIFSISTGSCRHHDLLSEHSQRPQKEPRVQPDGGHMYSLPLLPGIFLGVELLYRVVILFYLLRSLQVVLQSGCTTLHPTSDVGGFSRVSTPSPTLVLVCLFWNSHPTGCEAVSYCGFHLYFLGG